MDELSVRNARRRLDHRVFALPRQALDGNHGIGAVGQHGPGHDLHALTGCANAQGRGTCRLDAGHPVAAHAPRPVGVADGNAVHRHPIEGRLVAFRRDVLAQHATAGFPQRTFRVGQRRHASQDQGFGFGDIGHAARSG